ncbi:DUF3373 family protein [Caminibacter pacificus]
MKKLLLFLSASLLFASNQDIQKQIEKLKAEFNAKIEALSQRVDENEFEASINRIKWGGELEVNWGFYSGTYDNKHFSNPNKWNMRLKLNMETRINERTKFIGRLMMSKAWGNSRGEDLSQLDALQGRADGTSALFVERAYVDFHITKNFIMTIGRQPSSDGPGMNLKYDTPRKATYPALLFNGAADGVVFTYKYKNPYIPKCKFRFAYGKGYEWQDPFYGWAAENPGIKDTNVYGVFFEGALPIEKMGRNLFILTGVKTTHLVTNPFDDRNATANQDLGDYEHFGVYFENLRAFDTRWNYFVSFAYAIPKGNGKKGVADLNNDGVPDTEVELLKNNGYAYHIGGRYDFRHWKIGYEFNHGSKYWFSFSTNLYDPINKLAIRGNVHDFYAIYKVDLYQYFRLGYMYADINYNYDGMYYAPNGEPDKVNDALKLIYLTYDVRW